MRPVAHQVLVIGGFVAYGLLLLSLGIVLAGAGDGTYLPIFVFSAPLKYVSHIVGVLGAFALWLLVGLMVGLVSIRRARTTLLAILVMHYVGAFSIVLSAQAQELGRFTELFKIHPSLFATTFLIYLAGQVLIWIHYSRLRSS